MTARSLILIILFFALGLAACGDKGKSTNTNSAPNNTSHNAATPDPFATTRATFAKDCQKCHGEEGNGGPVKLDDGTKLKVPSLREGHALHHPDSDFVKQITKGGDGMPAFGDKLRPEEIDELIRFIRQEFQAGQTPATN